MAARNKVSGGMEYRGSDGAENELSNSLDAGAPNVAAVNSDQNVTALHLSEKFV